MPEEDTRDEHEPAARDEPADELEGVVERLRDEVQAARERVREAWQRYRSEAGGAPLPAVIVVLTHALTQAV